MLEETKECFTKFHVIPFRNVFFYSTLNLKNDNFLGHLDVVPCISIFSFYSDFHATNDVLGSCFAF